MLGPHILGDPCELELVALWVDFKGCKVVDVVGFSGRLQKLFVCAALGVVYGCDALLALPYSTVKIADSIPRSVLDQLNFFAGVVRGYKVWVVDFGAEIKVEKLLHLIWHNLNVTWTEKINC